MLRFKLFLKYIFKTAKDSLIKIKISTIHLLSQKAVWFFERLGFDSKPCTGDGVQSEWGEHRFGIKVLSSWREGLEVISELIADLEKDDFDNHILDMFLLRHVIEK